MDRRWLDRGAKWLVFLAGLWLAQIKVLTPYIVGLTWLKWLFGHGIAVYVAFLLVAAGLKLWALGQSKRDRQRGVQRVLDALVAEVIRTPANFSEHRYRASVYKYKKFNLPAWWIHRRESGVRPWSGWLVGIARSGFDSPTCRTRYRALRNPDHSADRGHGVCGTAWLLGFCEVVDLPVLTAQSGDQRIKKYAQQAFMTESEVRERIRRKKSLARTIRGERFNVGRKGRWGVLVYETADDAPIIDAGNASGNKLGVQSLSLFIEEFVR